MHKPAPTSPDTAAAPVAVAAQADGPRGVVLRAAGVGVDVGDRPLLRGVDFAVRAGETVALVGRSGAGKTTLLRALVGLHRLAAGHLEVAPAAAEAATRVRPSAWPALRRRLSLVPQRPIAVAGTVADNLALAFGLEVDRRGLDPAAARAGLDALGLDDVALGLEARALSEGQRQRLAIARALLIAPAVLLLDEPTSALDAASRDRVAAALAEFVAGRGAIVLISHDPALIAALGARSVALDAWVTT